MSNCYKRIFSHYLTQLKFSKRNKMLVYYVNSDHIILTKDYDHSENVAQNNLSLNSLKALFLPDEISLKIRRLYYLLSLHTVANLFNCFFFYYLLLLILDLVKNSKKLQSISLSKN
jgi:hypothetical protein